MRLTPERSTPERSLTIDRWETRGTITYAAPEMLRDHASGTCKVFTTKADVCVFIPSLAFLSAISPFHSLRHSAPPYGLVRCCPLRPISSPTFACLFISVYAVLRQVVGHVLHYGRRHAAPLLFCFTVCFTLTRLFHTRWSAMLIVWESWAQRSWMESVKDSKVMRAVLLIVCFTICKTIF